MKEIRWRTKLVEFEGHLYEMVCAEHDGECEFEDSRCACGVLDLGLIGEN